MLRAHIGDFVTTDLDTGERIEGCLLTVTSTKEKLSLALILREDGKAIPFFPDIESQGWMVTNTEHIIDVESVQTRENRRALSEHRQAVKFPPAMGQRTIPVMPITPREETHEPDAIRSDHA